MLLQASAESSLSIDDTLRCMPRAEINQLSAAHRLRWFYLMQCRHTELTRVTDDLIELLTLDNEVSIISVVGSTGIGKTTLAQSLRSTLLAKIFKDALPSETPVLLVAAPANGEKSLSWRVLYNRIFQQSREPLPEYKRSMKIVEGQMVISIRPKAGLADMREAVENMLKHRNVKLLIIDEAMHLLRFASYTAVMDTLKSLADVYSTKLLLIGSFDVGELMVEYGQVARRSEVIHYRRYHLSNEEDKKEFLRVLGKLLELWPCEEVPNLMPIGELLMQASVGSIGLLKCIALKLVALQMLAPGEKFKANMLKKAVKSKKALREIESETVNGEAALIGSTYGDSFFADETHMEVLKALTVIARGAQREAK
ncbi:AAA family ATPase [Polaromonas sp.]|uniref:AAA family ATPase n=1 Tax=Polaromonas sp. TaxID=1869339 RepID=UPI003753737A